MGALRHLGSATLRTARTLRALAPSSQSPAEREHTADSSLIDSIYMKKYGLEMLELGLRSRVSIARREKRRLSKFKFRSTALSDARIPAIAKAPIRSAGSCTSFQVNMKQ